MFSSLLQDIARNIMSIAMMAKEGSTKIVNFMIPGAEVLVLGHDHFSVTVFVCLFVCLLRLFLSHSRIFLLIWRRQHYGLRAANFDLYSAFMAVEQ